MPEETILNEVIENVETVEENEINILKVLAIGAGAAALGFAAFVGGRHLRNVIAAKVEAKNEETTPDADAEVGFKEVTEEDDK